MPELPTNPMDAKKTRIELERIEELLPRIREAAREGASDQSILEMLRGGPGELIDVPAPVAAAAGIGAAPANDGQTGPGADLAGTLTQILAEMLMLKTLLAEIRDLARDYIEAEGGGG
jgi:hypothetical protein